MPTVLTHAMRKMRRVHAELEQHNLIVRMVPLLQPLLIP